MQWARGPAADTRGIDNPPPVRQRGPAAVTPPGAVRLLYLLTAPFGLEKTLAGQLRYLRSAGFEPFFACSPGKQLRRFAASEGVRGEAVAIEREIAPLRDLRTLWQLWRLMRRIRPRVTNVSAPKAGLLGGLAAWLAGVPCRVYTLRGLRLETAGGGKYLVLWGAEWLACRLAQRVVCVSRCLARRAVELRLARPGKVIVAASGSSNGVDARRFTPGPAMARRCRRLRQRLGIPAGAPVLGFVGRLTRDKGIAELVAACQQLRQRRPSLRLLLVGCFESGDPVAAAVRDSIERDPGTIVTGFVDDPAPYYQLMDVVALPTYREGYPTVALEAAAAGRPFVTTRVTGAAGAVVDGETGLLVPAGDAAALARAVESLLGDPRFAAGLARRAQRQVVAEFSQQRIWRALEQVYRDLLAQQGGAGAAGRHAAVGGWGGPLPLPTDRLHRAQNCEEGTTDACRPHRRWWSFSRPARGSCSWPLSGGKRAFDIAAACLGLAAAGPGLLVVAGIVRLSMGGPILFRQPRSGLDGRQFRIYKFRTMHDDSRAVATEEERLAPAGRWLRRWSLDELPQLWNVLRGEMSLVGPRPLPLRYEPRYTPRQRRRHEVRPGLTGWAQLRGRNSLSWERRFELDLWYVEHASAWLDFQILIASVAMVLRGAGVTPPGAALMPEFLGEQRRPV